MSQSVVYSSMISLSGKKSLIFILSQNCSERLLVFENSLASNSRSPRCALRILKSLPFLIQEEGAPDESNCLVEMRYQSVTVLSLNFCSNFRRIGSWAFFFRTL